MAAQADQKSDTAAEKAYADAAEKVSVKKVAEAVEADKPVAKIDAAVAAEQAAPVKSVKPAAKRKPAAKKAGSKAKPNPKKAAPKVAAATSKLPISELKDKIMATAQKTEKTATDFTQSVKEAAADAQTRAKAAYDKLQAYTGEMTEFSKGNVEAIVESGRILGAGMQDMARGEFEAAKGAFETVTADLKAMAAVKSPTELFKLQGEIARRNFDAAVARYSKNAEVSMKLANDAFAPISNRMSLATEKFTKAA